MPALKRPAPIRKPWNQTPPETEQAIRRMIRDGIGRTLIMVKLGVGRTTVDRLIAQSKGGGLRTPPVRNPTKCNGTTDCNCVYHAAEAWKRSRRKPV